VAGKNKTEFCTEQPACGATSPRSGSAGAATPVASSAAIGTNKTWRRRSFGYQSGRHEQNPPTPFDRSGWRKQNPPSGGCLTEPGISGQRRLSVGGAITHFRHRSLRKATGTCKAARGCATTVDFRRANRRRRSFDQTSEFAQERPSAITALRPQESDHRHECNHNADRVSWKSPDSPEIFPSLSVARCPRITRKNVFRLLQHPRHEEVAAKDFSGVLCDAKSQGCAARDRDGPTIFCPRWWRADPLFWGGPKKSPRSWLRCSAVCPTRPAPSPPAPLPQGARGEGVRRRNTNAGFAP